MTTSLPRFVSAIDERRYRHGLQRLVSRDAFDSTDLVELEPAEVRLLADLFGIRMISLVFLIYAAIVPLYYLAVHLASVERAPVLFLIILICITEILLAVLFLAAHTFALRWGGADRELLYALRDVNRAAGSNSSAGIHRRLRERAALLRVDRHAGRLGISVHDTSALFTAARGGDRHLIAAEARMLAMVAVSGSVMMSDPAPRSRPGVPRMRGTRLANGAARVFAWTAAAIPLLGVIVGILAAFGLIDHDGDPG